MSPSSRLRLQRGVLDLDRRVIEGPSGAVRLTPTEARLIGFLAAHPERQWSRDALLQEVWGYEPGVRSRTVFSTVQRLRAKVELDPSSPRHILTSDGGYRFVPTDDELPEHLVGRQEAMSACLDAVAARRSPIWISGLGGVGKTSLAREVAARVERVGQAAVVWVDLEEVTRPAQVLDRVANALELRGADKVGRIRSALAARAPLLLVLDDLDGLGDRAESALEPLLDVPGVCVLGTARRLLRAERDLGVALSPLTPAASRQLLGRVAEQAGASLDGHDPAEIAALCEALDHLPLALVLAGRWLGRVSPRALVQSVEGLSTGESGRHGSLDACLAASWEQLGPVARADLTGLSRVGPSMPLELARAVVGTEALARLEALHERSLVTVEDDQVSIVGAVRRFAGARASAARVGEVEEAWWGWAIDAARGLSGVDDPVAVRRFTRIRRLVLTALDAMPDRPGWCDAVAAVTRMQLLIGLDDGIDARVARWVEVARASGHRESLGQALHLRGLVKAKTGRDALSDLQQALACLDPDWELLADGGASRKASGRFQSTAVHVAIDLAARLRARQALEEAGSMLGAALDEALRMGDGVLEARALLELGMLHRARDDADEAVGVLRRAATLARRLGHRRLEMMASGARASSERMRGRVVEAEILLRGALAAAEAVLDRENAAHLRGNLANLCMAAGRVTEAMRAGREALAHYREHGHVRSEGFALLTLGICELHRGDPAEAIVKLVASRDAFAVSRFPLGEACAWANLGRVRHHVGELAPAVDGYERALEGLGEPRGIAVRIRALLGLAYIESGDLGAARPLVAELPDDEPLVQLAHRGLQAARGASPPAGSEALETWVAEVRALLGSHRLERDHRWW